MIALSFKRPGLLGLISSGVVLYDQIVLRPS